MRMEDGYNRNKCNSRAREEMEDGGWMKIIE